MTPNEPYTPTRGLHQQGNTYCGSTALSESEQRDLPPVNQHTVCPLTWERKRGCGSNMSRLATHTETTREVAKRHTFALRLTLPERGCVARTCCKPRGYQGPTFCVNVSLLPLFACCYRKEYSFSLFVGLQCFDTDNLRVCTALSRLAAA